MTDETAPPVALDLVRIPGGTYPVGEGHETRRVEIAPFSIARFPVTNAEWRVYMESGGGPTPLYWDDPLYNDPHQPVVGVSWYEATAYCAWLSAQTGMDVRLPTEGEWEAAARGIEGRVYPWGDEWEDGRCNTWETGISRPTPAGRFPSGNTPEGLADMLGNVYEWTSSRWGLDDDEPDALRVVRGGCWQYGRDAVSAAFRSCDSPDARGADLGFRVAVDDDA
jgi:formylglycine-generating enzyme required for sulfatase activity